MNPITARAIMAFNPNKESVMNYSLLIDEEMHHDTQETQYDRKHPHHIVVASHVVIDTTEPSTKKWTDLMGKKYDAAEHGKVFNPKHIRHNTIGQGDGREPE